MMRDGELRECLHMLRGLRVVILGVGNVLKGDDGAGPLLCQALQGTISVPVIDAGTVPENYLWSVIKAHPQRVLIVDAVDFGGRPGAIGVFHAQQVRDVAVSTHASSLRLLADVLRTEIDIDVLLFGIQPESTQLGRPVSASVRDAIETLTDLLRKAFPAAKTSPSIPIREVSSGSPSIRAGSESSLPE